MAEPISGFEDTNENLYEIMWGVRSQLLAEILIEVQEIQAALTKFRQLDSSYVWNLGIVSISEADGSVTKTYTGEVKAAPHSPEEANRLFAIAEEAHTKLIETITEHVADDTDVIVELGAGYGGNLIRLDRAFAQKTGKSLSERSIKLMMAEYTNSGRTLCAEFLKCQNAPAMELHYIDHKAPDLSFLADAVNPLVFTVHSIEQVTEIPADYFLKLSKAGNHVRGLHVEPVGFQFEQDDPKWETHADFIKQKKYNQNFASVIKQAEQDGYITIDSIDTDFAAGQTENPSTLVAWYSNN